METEKTRSPIEQIKAEMTAGASGIESPNVIQVHESEWETYGFDRFDALTIQKADEDQYDFYVNVIIGI